MVTNENQVQTTNGIGQVGYITIGYQVVSASDSAPIPPVVWREEDVQRLDRALVEMGVPLSSPDDEFAGGTSRYAAVQDEGWED